MTDRTLGRCILGVFFGNVQNQKKITPSRKTKWQCGKPVGCTAQPVFRSGLASQKSGVGASYGRKWHYLSRCSVHFKLYQTVHVNDNE